LTVADFGRRKGITVKYLTPEMSHPTSTGLMKAQVQNMTLDFEPKVWPVIIIIFVVFVVIVVIVFVIVVVIIVVASSTSSSSSSSSSSHRRCRHRHHNSLRFINVLFSP
jgi:uncharacterized membrane protein